MLVEIEGDALHFQAISRTGRTIDAGTLSRAGRTTAASRSQRGHGGPSLIIATRVLNARTQSSTGRTSLNSPRF